MEIVTDIEKLRKPTDFVERDIPIHQVAKTLFDEMAEHNAQGLAANQVGMDLRMFVMKMNQRTPICVVNPLFIKTKGICRSNETCLSLPGQIVRVPRPERIRLKGYNQYWKPVSYTFTGIEARRACHEIDHLDGKLIIDYREEG